MRILYLSESMPHYYNSGVGTVIRACLRAATECGWQANVIGPGFKGCNLQPGYWLPSMLVGRGYRNVLTVLPAVANRLETAFRQTDIVHIHSCSPLTFRAMEILSKMSDRPRVILHLHTQVAEYLRKWFGVFAGPAVDMINDRIAWCCKQADLVIVPSEFFGKIACQDYLLKEEPFVWGAPIDTPSILPQVSREELLSAGSVRLPDDARIVFFVGRIEPEKNPEPLFRYIELIPDERICLVLAGAGKIKKYAKKVPKSIRHRVSFLGYTPRDRVLAYCRYADIGITASVTETFGLGILEQMAMGLPVMAPINTCFDSPIIASRGGEVLPPDPLLWARTIEWYLNDSIMARQAGTNGSAFIRRELSPQVQYRKLEQIYMRLLASPLLIG